MQKLSFLGILFVAPLFCHYEIHNIGSQTILEYTLSQEQTRAFNAYIAGESQDPYTTWTYYKTVGKQALLETLPTDLIGFIKSMRESNTPTAIIVHNMPLDLSVPSTPRNGNRPPLCGDNAKGFASEIMMLGVCSLLNCFPDFDEREKDGTYINQIIPRDDAGSRAKASSFGSSVPFYPHTENVYQVPPLKFFALLCLRGDPKVSTSIVFLDNILMYMKTHLPEGKTYSWMIEQMEKPQFLMKSGPSFEKDKVQTLLPILMKNEKGERVYRFNANIDRVEGINPEASFVVDYLRSILISEDFQEKAYTRIFLKKGDFLLFNNWEIMHARDAFEIDPDNWRWLQRCYFQLEEYKTLTA